MATHVADVQRIQRRIDAIVERYDGFQMGGLSWYYIRLIFLTGIGWAIDAMETLVFIYMAYSLSNVGGYNIEMSSAERSFLNGAVFVGSFFGSFIAGSMMDRYGRRPIFMLTAFILLLGMVLCGTSWDITSLTIFRLFAGLGLGGELPVISTLVQELSPKTTRGRIIVLLESFWAVGSVFAVILAYYVAPHVAGTWRTVYYLCMIPIIYSIAVRWMVPESPKWLASVGRYEEAVAIVETMERAHGLQPLEEEKQREQDVNPLSPFVLPQSHIERIALLFQSQFLLRTLVLWTLWTGISISYYAIFIMLPGLIGATKTSNGAPAFDINGSPSTMLFIVAMQLPGYFSAATLIEYLGRRYTLVIYLMTSFVFGIAFAYVDPTKTNILITASGLSFALLGSWGCVYAYTPENYPTAIRGIGGAYPGGFSRIGAFMGPYVCTWLLEWGASLHVIMWIFGGVLALIAMIVFVWGFEPKGKDIESYTHEKENYHATTATPVGLV